MKTIKLTFVLFLFSFVFTKTFAQLTVKDSDNNILLNVNDYGTAGTVTLPSFGPILPSLPINNYMLYNVNGTLYWNGSSLGTSNNAAGWTRPLTGGKIYTSDLTDKVEIGTINPLSKLSVGGDGFVDAAVYGIESQTGNIKNYGGYFRSNGDEEIGVIA